MNRIRTTLVLGAALSIALPARADGPLGPNGAAIATSNYTVDLTQGPVLAGTRVIGLAGAYVAIAEGTDGNTQNPATPAVRVPWSYDYFDYDLGFGITFPTSIGSSDYFNSGRDTDLADNQDGFVFLNVAANIQLGTWGAGLTLDYQRYSLQSEVAGTGPLQGEALFAQFGVTHLIGARTIADGQLALGVGLRGAGMVIRNESPSSGEPRDLFSTEALAPEVGALWRPNDLPFRVGGALRASVVTEVTASDVTPDANGDLVIGTPPDPSAIYLPREIVLPWEASVGVAVQFGPRPFNPRWIDPEAELANLKRFMRWRERERERNRRAKSEDDPERARLEALDAAHVEREALELEQRLRARYMAMKRFYLLVSASVLATGELEDAVGVESFLARVVHRSGREVTYSPRLGVESEVVPDWVKLRAGTYFEPSRFEGIDGRLHGTFGFDAKLFAWTVFGLFDEDTAWRASAAVDNARGYFGWSVSVGVWH